LRDSSVHIISCIRTSRSTIRQDPRLSPHARKFCRPTSRVGVLEQIRYWGSIEGVVFVRRKCVNIKIAITMTAMMTPCSTAILTQKSILQILHLQHRGFHKRVGKKVFRENGDFHSK